MFHRFGMFLVLLDQGEDMAETTYNTEGADLQDIIEGLTPELAAALTRQATANAKIAEHKATEARLQIANIKASNDHNRVLVVSGPILETDEISNVLMRWSRRDPGKDITIYLNTMGGSVFDGNALGHTIDQLRAKGHKVTIFGAGTVLSMGAVLLQYADERVLAKDAVFMIHSLSGNTMGSIESIIDTTEMWKAVNDRLLTKLTERSTMTKATLKKKVARKEWFLTADEALKYGFCDRIE
jgi:ATP-dependent Clp protease protease subunit